MLKPLFNQFLQHLMAQNPWANSALMPWAGRHIQISVLMLHAKLSILENGQLTVAPDSASCDASIRMNPSTLIRLASGDMTAQQQIELIGDTELAIAVSKVLRKMRWDIEQDASVVIGDIPAHQIGKLARQGLQYGKQQAVNLAEMLVEYWQEEKALLAKKRHVENFVKQVDTLRDDVSRLEKRIQRLNQSSTEAA